MQQIKVELVPAEKLVTNIHNAIENGLPVIYLPDSSRVRPGVRSVEHALKERLQHHDEPLV